MKAQLLLVIALAAPSFTRAGAGQLLIQGHGHSAPPFTASEVSAPQDQIKLRRTTCFGRCPAYTVTVKSDGSISFNGTADTNVERAESSMRSKDWQRLLATMRRARFFAMRDTYTTEADGCRSLTSDQPSMTIAMKLGTAWKQVTVDMSCEGTSEAEIAKRLATTIDRTANTQRWVRAK